jgi:hypothetical protein
MVLARPGLQVFGAGIPAFSEGRDGEQGVLRQNHGVEGERRDVSGQEGSFDGGLCAFNEEALKLAGNK